MPIGALPVYHWPLMGGYNHRHAMLKMPIRQREPIVPSWMQNFWVPEDGSIITSLGMHTPDGSREDTYINRHTRNPADPTGFWLRAPRMRLYGAGHGTNFAWLGGRIILNWSRDRAGNIVDQLVQVPYVADAEYWLDSPEVQPYGPARLSEGYVSPYYDRDNDLLMLRRSASGASTFTLRRRSDFENDIDDPLAVLGPISIDHTGFQTMISDGTTEMLYLTGGAWATGELPQMLRRFDLRNGHLCWETPATFHSSNPNAYGEPEGGFSSIRGVTKIPQVYIGYMVRPGFPEDQYAVVHKLRHPKAETDEAIAA